MNNIINNNIKKYKIAISCGGTGGHIFPGIAIANALKSKGHNVTLWLSGHKIEYIINNNWGGNFIKINSIGLPAKLSSIKNLFKISTALIKTLKAIFSCYKIMKKDRPDVILAMGSYASSGPVGAAIILKIPFILHEANIIPGRAIKTFARWAKYIAINFADTRNYLKQDKNNIYITGLPIRNELSEQKEFDYPIEFNRDNFTILITGGSLGAKKLNEIIPEAIIKIAALCNNKIQIIHLTGKDNEIYVKEIYKKANIKSIVKEFSNDMASLYKAANLAISRAGAATCAELCYFNLPTLFIPFPQAINNHQTMNARALEKLAVADVITEDTLTVEKLAEYLKNIINNP